MVGHIDPTKAAMTAFRELPSDRPIAMINLLRFRDRADYPADHAKADAGLTGAEAYSAYGKGAAAPFDRVGGEQLWLGRPEITLIGPAEEAWDLAFIARYPTAQAFADMLRDPEYQAAVIHRQAAVADSRLIRCEPALPAAGFGESAPA
ncbi:MAG: DUF1330 domain-containing protein [Alphaproteobacteria bacterium]|nr:DUF1330 domain-containing protein [Alphaproteobacteria bacterium]MBU2378808.1 DUF1330 domain-containing protein [Alphaproteobacteria bacterium]